jgi:DNA-binding CsgD family transcriptional regulator
MPRTRDHNEADELSALIGDAYDASLDPELWPLVLERVGAFVRGSMVNLFSQDVVNHQASRLFTWGGEPQYHTLYLEKYAALNPLFPKGLFFPEGEVLVLTDIITYAAYRGSRFYKEWAAPQGFVDLAGVIIEKAATSLAALAVVRGEQDGLVDDETVRRMRLIAPHIRRALLIGKVIDLNKLQTANFAQTIDGLAAGVFLVSPQGELVHANARGQAMLDAGEPLRFEAGTLIAADATVQASLQRAFADSVHGDAVIEANGIALPLRSAGTRYIAHVLPLTSGTRRSAGAFHSAAAALFVREAKVDLPAALNAAAQLYGLTPAEERVVRGVIEVGSASAVAELLGIGPSTVKKHLEHVFEKTGTRRQAELVNLIAGFDSPARGTKTSG